VACDHGLDAELGEDARRIRGAPARLNEEVVRRDQLTGRRQPIERRDEDVGDEDPGAEEEAAGRVSAPRRRSRD